MEFITKKWRISNGRNRRKAGGLHNIPFSGEALNDSKKFEYMKTLVFGQKARKKLKSGNKPSICCEARDLCDLADRKFLQYGI